MLKTAARARHQVCIAANQKVGVSMTEHVHSKTVSSKASPTDNSRMQSCIDACISCARDCGACGRACLETASQETVACAKACLDCQEICLLATGLMQRTSPMSAVICRACADACDACAKECDRHTSEHCRRCAEACRACAIECRRMAGAA